MTHGDQHGPSELDTSTQLVGLFPEAALRDGNAFLSQKLNPLGWLLSVFDDMGNRRVQGNERATDEVMHSHGSAFHSKIDGTGSSA